MVVPFQSFLLGIPFLLLFYLVMNSVTDSFSTFLVTLESTILFLVYVVFALAASYMWYTFSLLLYEKRLFSSFRIIYKRFFSLFPLFFLFLSVFLVAVAMDAWVLANFLTDAFYAYSWLGYLVSLLFLVALLQVVRLLYVEKVLHPLRKH